MARLWRLFHFPIPQAVGSELWLSPEESHHVRRVLRLREGETVCLFDGRGLTWEGQISRIEPSRVRVVLTRPASESAEPELQLELHQGLCRADRMEWIVQKGTELGLAALHCYATRRSELREVGTRRLERWHRIATEAAKQSGRSVIPEIVEGGSQLPAVSDSVPSWIAALDRDAPALGELCAGIGTPRRLRIAIGPEPGFEPGEVDAACEAGWNPTRLGPRTLRAETAAIAATALIMALSG